MKVEVRACLSHCHQWLLLTFFGIGQGTQHAVSITLYLQNGNEQKSFDLARTRTWNPLIRSQMPYPLGHEAIFVTLLPHAIDSR